MTTIRRTRTPQSASAPARRPDPRDMPKRAVLAARPLAVDDATTQTPGNDRPA